MKQKYYVSKTKHLRRLRTYLYAGSLSLGILIAVNAITHATAGVLMVSYLLAGVVLITLIALYRTLFLLKLPLIIMDDTGVRYFNALWYNRRKWEQFELAMYNAADQTLSIGLANGRIYDRFLLDSLNEQDIEKINRHFAEKNKLVL